MAMGYEVRVSFDRDCLTGRGIAMRMARDNVARGKGMEREA